MDNVYISTNHLFGRTDNSKVLKVISYLKFQSSLKGGIVVINQGAVKRVVGGGFFLVVGFVGD